jgi:hypothetical protein
MKFDGMVTKYPTMNNTTNSQNCVNTKGKNHRERDPEVPTNQVILNLQKRDDNTSANSITLFAHTIANTPAF